VKRISDKAYLIKNTSIVSLCRAIGVLTGLFLDAVILASFGLGHETDAFFAALTIPFLIDGIVSVQFVQVLVPTLTSIQKESGANSLWSFLSNLITIWLLTASVVACAIMGVATSITQMQVPGLAPSAIHMAGNMSMMLVWLIPLSGLGAMLQGALFSFHQYWLSSSTKAINNVCIVSIVLSFHRSIGIYALALGYLAGFAAQCVVLWIALARCGFAYQLSCNFRDPRLKDNARLVLYPLAGQMLGECRTLIENFFASFYAPGVLSALRYASRIIFAQSGLLAGGVVTATAPMVAHYMAEKDLEGMKRALRNGIQLLVFISLPMCVWLIFAGDSLISLLFERGQFSKADVALTSSLMALMTPYILFSRAISITQIPFYAVKDTKTLVLGMILSFILYVLVTPPLLYWLGVYGFPLATSAATALGTLAMCILLRKSFGEMGWRKLASFARRMSFALVLTSVAFICARGFVFRTEWGGLANKLLAAGIPSFIGLFAFFLAAVALRLFDLQATLARLGLLRARKPAEGSLVG